MKKCTKSRGITLIALVITVIILLILAGVAISALGGENGLIAKVRQAKKAQIKSEMKEQLVLALSELQLEKNGEAILDDVTQEWANNILKDYEPIITNDASTSGKKVTMSKSGIVGKYLIDEKLNIVEIGESTSSIEFSYDVLERIDNKVSILIHVRDRENGLTKIEFPDIDPIIANGTKEERGIDYKVEIGTEYNIKITSESGEVREETILITDYWHKITNNLGEGISIDNTAVKAAYNKPYTATLTTGNEYILETLIVTMGGKEVTVDKTTGVINIEKVTGDIEITATAKKLEIIVTSPYIGTSFTEKDSTKSVDDNTQTRGTILYINFKATLEETNCTITLKDDASKTVPYEVMANGKYTFIVTGTYNGMTITKEIEIVVNKYQAVGGFVQYDAGDWTKDEIKELQDLGLYNINISKKASTESGLNFTFGGFTYKSDVNNNSYINNGTIITNRNQSVSCYDSRGEIMPNYEGWQILDSKEENGKIYIKKVIHAGSPENFVYCYTTSNDAYRSEYILSGGERQKIYNTYSPRKWDMYKDKELDTKGYIYKVYAITYNEIKTISDKIAIIGSCYWMASAADSFYLYYKGDSTSLVSGYCLGVRPVVEMNDGVYIASGSGTESDPYVLGKD